LRWREYDASDSFSCQDDSKNRTTNSGGHRLKERSSKNSHVASPATRMGTSIHQDWRLPYWIAILDCQGVNHIFFSWLNHRDVGGEKKHFDHF
jgi:hypothetical protein